MTRDLVVVHATRRAARLIAPLPMLVALLAVGCASGTGKRPPRAAGPAPGPVLRFQLDADIDSADPALQFTQVSWQIGFATCLKLVNYPDEAGAGGLALEPEAAALIPTPTDGGRIYRFRVRRGFRFSPPSAEPVTAESFRRAIERVLDPRMDSAGAGFIADIEGAAAFHAGDAKSVRGLQVRGPYLMITLVAPAGDFLQRLAMPFFCAVPTKAPIRSAGLILPSAGPYYIARWVPTRTLILRRNPNYHGPRPHFAREIDYTLGVDPARSVSDVEQGRADYAAEIPVVERERLIGRYGPRSSAARARGQRYFINPELDLRYFALNTERPLFADRRVRRAVNLAVDRRAMVSLLGPDGGVATDQYIPRGLPGFADALIYPLDSPDVASARRLLHEVFGTAQPSAILYTCTLRECRDRARLLRSELAQIGITLTARSFDPAAQAFAEREKDARFDLTDEQWLAPYGDPSSVIDRLLGSRSLSRGETFNVSRFSAGDARMRAASRLIGLPRAQAYAALDLRLARDDAPLVAWGSSYAHDFFSARIGCQVYQPLYGIDIARLCVRKARR